MGYSAVRQHYGYKLLAQLSATPPAERVGQDGVAVAGEVRYLHPREKLGILAYQKQSFYLLLDCHYVIVVYKLHDSELTLVQPIPVKSVRNLWLGT